MQTKGNLEDDPHNTMDVEAGKYRLLRNMAEQHNIGFSDKSADGLERLHAYWRMAYIKAPKTEARHQNPFKHIPHMESERESGLLFRGKHNYIVMNRYPYNAGHLLVAPYGEVSRLAELDTAERTEHLDLVIEAERILTEALAPDGFNVGYNLGSAGGAGIPTHLHCHIVPRWSGDTNFMPVIGNTRVLPEAMEAMWERLRAFAPKGNQRS